MAKRSPLNTIDAHILAGRLDDAEAAARDAIEQQPIEGRLQWVRALSYVGRFEEARRVAAEALAEAESIQDPIAIADALIGHGGLGNARWSMAHLRRAVEIADMERATSQRIRARLALARELATTRDAAAAELLLDEARGLDPGMEAHPSYCQTRGMVAEARRDLDDAERWFRRAASLAVGDASRQSRSLVHLAGVLRRRGRLEEAAAEVQAALNALEDCPGAHFPRARAHVQLGEIQRAMGRFDEAARSYELLVELAGEHRPFENALAHLNLALVQLQRGRIDLARPHVASLQGAPLGPVTSLGARLASCVCAADADDVASWDASFPAVLDPWFTPVDADLGWLTARAAELASGRDDRWLDRAARAHRLALNQAVALGDDELRAAQRTALKSLAGRGVRTPLGPFALERQLGSGAFGQVWLASHRDGTRVAIKVLGGRFPEHASRQLANELRAVAGLDHPHIVPLLHHGVVDEAAAWMQPDLAAGSTWIATRFAPGGALDAHMGQLAFADLQPLLLGLLEGLAHAHARRVLHLDVKPANVLLSSMDADRTTLLADFGLATAMGAESRRVAGTPQFMAPEQFQPGMRDLGPWTDLYAVGCLTVAMVAGAPPWDGTVPEVRRGHLSGEWVFRPCVEVPADLESWIRRLLAKHPSDRFRRAADAARALRALRGPPTRADGSPQIRPSEKTTLILDDAATTEPKPLASVPGACSVPEPAVPVDWRVAGVHPKPTFVEAGLGLFGLRRTSLVGRTHERSLLWAALRSVHAEGRARAVVLEAEPGHGVRMLARWLCERAHETGAATPLVGGSLSEVLADHLRLHALDGEAARQRLRRLLPEVSSGELRVLASALGANAPKSRTLRRVQVRAIGRIAAERLVVIWLTEETDPMLISQLLVLEAPVLIVVTGAVTGDAPTMLDEARVVWVPVPPMPAQEIEALARGRMPVADALSDRIVAVAQGSPRVADQLLAHLVAADRLVVDEGGWRLRSEYGVPTSAAGLWSARLRVTLASAHAEERAALEVAAVLGRSVVHELWARACHLVDRVASAGLRARLLDAGLARSQRSGWRFVDEGIASLVVAGIPDATLRQLHHACASAYGSDHPQARARHLQAAGDPAQAVAAWVEAIDRFAALGDAGRGRALIEPTAALIADLPAHAAVGPRAALLRIRGQGAMASGRYEEACDWFVQAFEMAVAGGVEPEEVVAACALADVGCPPTYRDAVLQTLARAAAGDTPELRAKGLYFLARRDRRLGDLDVAEVRLEAAQRIVEAQDLPSLRAQIYEALASIALRRSDPARARRLLEAAVAVQEAAGHPIQACLAELSLGDVLRMEGELDAAVERFEDVRGALLAVGSIHAVVATVNIVLVRWEQGRTTEADELALKLWRAPQPSEPGPQTVIALAALVPTADGGTDADFAAVIDRVEHGPDRVRSTPDGQACLRSAAVRAVAAGRPERADRVRALLA